MKTDYISALKKFKKHKVLVIGDFILDAYVQGSCTRLAPEASVPVVDVFDKSYCLGGAANAAANLSAMGAKVLFCSVTGDDAMANVSQELLQKVGISSDFIVADSGRSTIVKTRVCSSSHTLVRFDEGTEKALATAAETALIDNLHHAYFQCDAVLVADYDKGVLTPTVIAELKKLKLIKNKFIAVDSKRVDAFKQICPSLIKPNYGEAIKLLSLPHTHQSRPEQLMPYGKLFFEKTNASLIALTLDEDGALFFKDGELVHRVLAPKATDPNVSGAGDTFISALLLSLMAASPIAVGAEIATTAARIAIARKDTATCSWHEIVDVFTAYDKTIASIEQFKQKCNQLKNEGKRIVFTNGCFDILHSGHVNYLRKAREMGDILIVGLNNDESIKRLKGKNRPVNTLKNRMEVLSAIACIDYIVPFGHAMDDTPIKLIKAIKPDVFVKGGDYQDQQLPELEILERLGCKISFIRIVNDQSTTKIIAKVQQQGPPHLKIAMAN
jgi:D-beta-D-heptose 7-phosphate kinase/D-beta-D-heptose 1-phosphate adenosyltransferase